MNMAEKAAYFKGLAEGLNFETNTREGALWTGLCRLITDMAHEIDELRQSSLDFADMLDEMSDELSYLEELTCDLDMEHWDEDDDDDFGGFTIVDDDDDDDEEYDGVLYDVSCPVCGEEITLDEEMLEEGSVKCPGCGEELEFDLGEDEDEDKKDD